MKTYKMNFFVVVVVDRLYCSFTLRLKKHCSEALWLYAYFIQWQMFYRHFGHFTTDLYRQWKMNILSIKKSLELKSGLESMIWDFRKWVYKHEEGEHKIVLNYLQHNFILILCSPEIDSLMLDVLHTMWPEYATYHSWHPHGLWIILGAFQLWL